jgi:hypothetical protein
MFAITTKAKIAAGIAAGALTLGAAGAYAANANNSVTTYPLTSAPLSHNGQTLTLVSTNSNVTTLTLPSTPFTDAGQCVSWFATNRNFALQPQTGAKVTKNYHGKLMSGVHSFCATYKSTTATSADTETPDTTQSGAPSTNSGASHGNGHGRP